MQSVMTRTATLRAPSGSMTDVFACARAQIYYNIKRKPLAQVKRESGCSHIINGYLFNGSFQPVGWTVIDGKVISRDAYQDWGISIGSDGKPQMLTDRGGSFLSGVPLLKNGAKLERSLTPDVARSAARTAVGWMPDGRICLWCDKTSLTREQLQNKLLGLGISDALMLDGGGSTQGRFPDGAVTSSRKVATLLLFWQEAEAAAPENPAMKWMIASDLHGSAFYCKKMIKAFERERADRLLLLGDLLYHGPRNDLPEGYAPKEVIPLLNGLKPALLCVRGNCDAEVDQMVLDFPILADYAVLPVGRRLVYATHGHVHNLKNLPPLAPGDVLLHGHTHIPAWTEFGKGNLYLNPGSVSIPKEGSAHSYMTLEGETFLWKTLEGEAYRELEL